MNDERPHVPSGDGFLAVAIDEPQGSHAGTVLLIPPFGMTSAQTVSAACCLTANGFRVVRFDPRDHPGRSSGRLRRFRMSRLVDDIAAMLARFDAEPPIVVAISLSARAALRALRGRDRITAAVLLMPVVDVRFTLEQVIGVDLFVPENRAGKELTSALGLVIETAFIDDCVQYGFVDPRDALADILGVSVPIVAVTGADDPWAPSEDVRLLGERARACGREFRVVTVEAATHQLYRSPALAMAYFTEMAREALREVGRDPTGVRVPAFAEIIAHVNASGARRGEARA